MNGKGSKSRPPAVSKSTYSDNWERTFGGQETTAAGKRYLQLMSDLLAARQLGVLSQKDEVDRACAMDDQWAQMTDSDREQAEAVWAEKRDPTATGEHGLRDA